MPYPDNDPVISITTHAIYKGKPYTYNAKSASVITFCHKGHSEKHSSILPVTSTYNRRLP